MKMLYEEAKNILPCDKKDTGTQYSFANSGWNVFCVWALDTFLISHLTTSPAIPDNALMVDGSQASLIRRDYA
jgi:hypothetical protein